MPADKDKYTTPESLKNAMIGAQKGAIQVGIAKKQIKGMKDDTQDNAQVKELPKLGDLVLSLKNKNIDAIVVETGVAKAYVAANPDLVVAPPSSSPMSRADRPSRSKKATAASLRRSIRLSCASARPTRSKAS